MNWENHFIHVSFFTQLVIMKIEKISVKKLLTDQNIEFKNEYLTNNFIVIPNSTMTIEDISLIKKTLGFEPKIYFEEGLKKTIEWYKMQH